MKIVQTFWTGPAAPTGNLLDLKAGWLAAEYHWMSWALSCLQLRKLYERVELVTDKLGQTILVDMLGLPYTSVSTVLEGRLNGYAPELWSLAKLTAFAEQQEPFLHIDGDFFIWQALPERITQAGIVAQNLEVNLSYYRDMMQDMERKGWRMPPVLESVSQSPIIYAANTGIFGGHHLAFIQQYCRSAFDFVNSNAAIVPHTKTNQLNFIFEQCLLYYLAQQEGGSIEYLMEEPVDEPSYQRYARFMDVPQVTMVHTLGDYKKMPFVCSQMAKRLRHDFPDAYYRIIALCGDMGITNTIYHIAPFNSVTFYPQQYREGMQQYLSGILQFAKQNAPALLHSAEGLLVEQYFARSQKVIQLLTNPDYAVAMQLEPLAGNYLALQQLMGTIKDEAAQSLAAEIFDIDKRVFLLAMQMNDPVFLQRLYFKELLQYQQVNALFANAVFTITAATVGIDETVEVVDCNWNWNITAADITLDFVQAQLAEVGEVTQLMLKADVGNGEVAQLYPEGIDAIIIDLCSNDITIADILENLQQYFDEAELANDYSAYQKLILDTVKQLLLDGLLVLR